MPHKRAQTSSNLSASTAVGAAVFGLTALSHLRDKNGQNVLDSCFMTRDSGKTFKAVLPTRATRGSSCRPGLPARPWLKTHWRDTNFLIFSPHIPNDQDSHLDILMLCRPGQKKKD